MTPNSHRSGRRALAAAAGQRAGRSAGAAGAVCSRFDQPGGRSGDGRVAHRVAPRDRFKVAQRTLQESQEKLAAWFERELSDAATEQADRRHAALARFQVESTTCERQFVHLQQQAAEEFEAGLRLAKRKLEETGWEAEAYFDGNKQIAPKALEEFTIQVDAWRTRAAEEHDKARKLLRRWKQQPPEVVVDPNAFDAAGDDYAGRLPERVGAITAELDRLSGLTAPGLAASRVLPGFYLLSLALDHRRVGLVGLSNPLAAGAVFACALVAGIGGMLVIRGAAAQRNRRNLSAALPGRRRSELAFGPCLGRGQGAHPGATEQTDRAARSRAPSRRRTAIRPKWPGWNGSASNGWPAPPKTIRASWPKSPPPAIASLQRGRGEFHTDARPRPAAARLPIRPPPPNATIARSSKSLAATPTSGSDWSNRGGAGSPDSKPWRRSSAAKPPKPAPICLGWPIGGS